MTETERKALALVNEIERQERLSDLTPRIMRGLVMDEALCRAIERHEAFRKEVSDALEKRGFYIDDRDLGRFIITKPDPLVDAFASIGTLEPKYAADNLRAAIEKRGGKIVWEEG